MKVVPLLQSRISALSLSPTMKGNSRSCWMGWLVRRKSLIVPYTHAHTFTLKYRNFLDVHISAWFTHMKRAILIVDPFWISNPHHYICYRRAMWPFHVSIFLWQELVADVIWLFDKFYVKRVKFSLETYIIGCHIKFLVRAQCQYF